MFGSYVITPQVWRTSVIKARTVNSAASAQWRAQANEVALIDTRLAARMRDVADALANLAFLCGDIVRQDGEPT